MEKTNLTYNDRVRYTLQNNDYGSVVIDEPIGWDEDRKEYARHLQYHGVIVKFSSSLKFIRNGADFIQLVYDTRGINADIRILKDEKHPHTDIWTRVYDGYLDLSTYVWENNAISIKIYSGSIEKLLKARHSEQLELDRTTTMDGYELEPLKTHQIKLDGRKIFLESLLGLKHEDKDNNTTDTKVSSKAGNDRTQGAAVPMNLVTRSHEEIQAVQNISRLTTGYEGNGSVGDMFFFNSERDRTVDVKINFTFSYRIAEATRSRGERVLVRLVRYGGGNLLSFVSMESLIFDRHEREVFDMNKVDIPINENIKIKLKKGESLSLQFFSRARVGSNPNRAGHFNLDFYNIKGSLTVKEDSEFKSSNATVLMAHEAADRLITIATNKKNIFYSEFLGRTDIGYQNDGNGSLTALTHGFWVREFPKEYDDKETLFKPMTTSLKDFMESFKTVWNVGMGIERSGYKETVRIEELSYFYNRNVTIRLPNKIKNVKRSIANDKYFSSVEIGYEKGGEYDEAPGLDEFNGMSTYTTIITRIKEVFTRISKYRADSYGMEFARRKPFEYHAMRDTKYDNDIWFLDLIRKLDGFKQRVWRDDFQKKPTGIYNPETATNLRFSPFNLLLRHGWTLGACLKKYPGERVRYASSSVNSNLKTQLIGKKEYAENGTIINSELDKPHYVPEWIEFDHICDFKIMQQVDGYTNILGKPIRNFYGLVEFTNEKNEIERGFLFEVKPNKAGRWKVLKANR